MLHTHSARSENLFYLLACFLAAIVCTTWQMLNQSKPFGNPNLFIFT